MDSVLQPEEEDGFFTINVKIKASLPTADTLNVNLFPKTFTVNEREYPIERFGSWALSSVSDQSGIDNLLTNGGLSVAITWGLREVFGEILVWVSDPKDNSFIFEMKKSEHKRILEDITSGKMASLLESTLKSLKHPSYFENVKIKLIQISRETSTKENSISPEESASDEFDQQRMERLSQAETVARHMKSKQYSWAITILKQCIAKEKNEAVRLQLLIRTYICASHLKNEKDMAECLPRLISSIKSATIPPAEVSLYTEEYQELWKILISTGSAVQAIEIGLAFQQTISRIQNAEERLDMGSANIQRLCEALKCLLKINPGACLKGEIRKYISQVQSEIDSMKKEVYCDSLLQAQSVYYSEFALSEVKNAMEKHVAAIFKDASVEFKRISSCWADFPFVITRLRRHPDISKYLNDEDYIRTLKKISMKPTVLEKYIKDPKIAEAHEVLASEFGLFEDSAELNGDKESPSEKSEDPGDKKEEGPVDKKLEAQKEKEKGNDAYKKLDFPQAHLHYNQAIALDPSEAMFHLNKAAVFISQQDLTMAKKACLFALDLAQKDKSRYGEKDFAKIVARLARAEFLDGRCDIALDLFEKSLGLHHDDKVQDQMKECRETIRAARKQQAMNLLGFTL